jgi:hypothetical protein
MYFQAQLADGVTTTGNSFNLLSLTPDSEYRITIRKMLDESLLLQLSDATILAESKRIPPNNSKVSGITDVYLNQTFTITINGDSIQFLAVFKNTSSNVINTNPLVDFSVNYGTGRFKDVKRVSVWSDSDGTAPWNPNKVKYARKLEFYAN